MYFTELAKELNLARMLVYRRTFCLSIERIEKYYDRNSKELTVGDLLI